MERKERACNERQGARSARSVSVERGGWVGREDMVQCDWVEETAWLGVKGQRMGRAG